MYYTYAYLREDKTPYYIGKGKGKRVYNRKAHLQHGIFVPIKENILFLKTNLNEEEALKHEKYMIFIFGRKCNNSGVLRNNLDEGGRVFLTEEQKQKRNEAIKLAYTKEEVREKIRKTSAGRKHSQQSKEKLRKIALSKPNNGFSDECRVASKKATSKVWTIQRPCGKIETIISMREWCINNDVNYGSMKNVMSKKLKSYKGYKLL
jgi:hypothetical protein